MIDRRGIAGSLILTGSGLFLLGMVVAEAHYPGYSARENYISDLGVGPGGMERMIVYPMTAWSLGLRGALMGPLWNKG